MKSRSRKPRIRSRRGATLTLTAVFIVVVLGVVAAAVDLGYVVLVRTQLQAAADSSAMVATCSMDLPRKKMLAVTRQNAGYHTTQGKGVELPGDEVEYGTWDVAARTFTPSPTPGNAVRVTARADDSTTGESRPFFGRIFNRFPFSQRASAVAMANPRDIAFVVDLSGSMNDDTEPCWATEAINSAFAADGYPAVGNDLMQDLYDDFGFGSYPGPLQYIGEGVGVPQNSDAYAELTKDGGPLTKNEIPEKYRIKSSDDETTRKRKAYSAMIDYQIAEMMPNAKPTPDSAKNYAYWEKYIDYIIITPPTSRGTIPPSQDNDRIYRFNNPNTSAFPEGKAPWKYRNRIGYLTYVQFMLDHGRDLKPEGNHYVPLSKHSPYCPWHEEITAGGTLSFPPRSQPLHAARRALIAAIAVIKQRNASIVNPDQRDRVSIITFDTLAGGGPFVKQPLTADYDVAMLACTDLQAVGDKGATTATESGLIAAREHLRPKDQGGVGRCSTNKIVVLLTDGLPNLYSSDPDDVDAFIADHAELGEFYDTGEYWKDAPLMQVAQMQAENWYTFPVGVGLGTDYDFMDRLARLGQTANDARQSARGSGNPAEYEQRLIEIFEEIIRNPKVRLVQ